MMRARPSREVEMLTVSALDLFASALGVFILMAIMLFPYFLKLPALETAVEGARQQLADARGAMNEAERRADAAEARLRAAEARLATASADRARAEASLAAAEARAQAAAALPVPKIEPTRRPSMPRPGTVTIGDLDVVFVIDATGSMRDEITDVQRNLLSIIRVLGKLAPSLRMGVVAFRDRGDAFFIIAYPLAPTDGGGLDRLQAFVRQLHADGGGDPPEPIGEALKAAIDMAWRPTAKGRIVVISDAPAHANTWMWAQQLAAGFARSAVAADRDRRVSAIFTGDDAAGRDFHMGLAQAGRGDFITHRGRMMESVLLSILAGDGGRG